MNLYHARLNFMLMEAYVRKPLGHYNTHNSILRGGGGAQ